LGKLVFSFAQAFKIRLGTGRGASDTLLQGDLRGIGQARLEGRDAGGPVEAGGEAADGGEGTSGGGGGRPMGATPLQAEIGDKGVEVFRRFTGLPLPETGMHREGQRLKS